MSSQQTPSGVHIFGQSRVIAFNYVLKNSKGELLDASEPNQPMPFLEGKMQIIPKLEEVLSKMSEGEKKKVELKAVDAYGEFSDKMVMEVERKELAHLNVELGAHVQLQLGEQARVVRVAKMNDTHVTLDGNHPLAGVDLTFDVEVVMIRTATPEEITHGHAHGLHGHAHNH